jgi:predicted MFS family arabinose efflux permease
VNRLVLVFGLGGFSQALSSRVLDPLVPVVAAEFAAPVDMVALIATAFALPYALIQPVLGPVGDAFGKRRIIIGCMVSLVVALAACAMAPSIETLFVARIASGLAAGGVFPLTLALLGDSVGMDRRQVALSRFLAFAILGQVAGGAMAPLVEPLVGWRGVLWVSAGLAAIGLGVLLAGGRVAETTTTGRFGLGVAIERYGAILRSPVARMCYAAVAVEGALIFGAFPYLADILLARGHGGPAEAGTAIGLFGAGGLLYAALAAWLLGTAGPLRMLWGGGVLAAAGLAASALAPSAAVLIGAHLVLGFGFFMMHNSIQTRVTEVAPSARGSAVALHAFFFFLGHSLGPILYGPAIGVFGSAAALLGGAAGIAALAWWLRGMPQPTGNKA